MFSLTQAGAGGTGSSRELVIRESEGKRVDRFIASHLETSPLSLGVAAFSKLFEGTHSAGSAVVIDLSATEELQSGESFDTKSGGKLTILCDINLGNIHNTLGGGCKLIPCWCHFCAVTTPKGQEQLLLGVSQYSLPWGIEFHHPIPILASGNFGLSRK
jgi:hypothetical protein